MYCTRWKRRFTFPAPNWTWNIKAVAISSEARRSLPFLQLFPVYDLIYENISCIMTCYFAKDICDRCMASMKKKMFQHFITWRLMTHNILQNAKSKEMGERETPSCASNYGNYGTHSCLIVQLKRRAECWSSVFYSSIHGVRLQQR